MTDLTQEQLEVVERAVHVAWGGARAAFLGHQTNAVQMCILGEVFLARCLWVAMRSYQGDDREAVMLQAAEQIVRNAGLRAQDALAGDEA